MNGLLSSVEARRIVGLASRAPSIHNTQPWSWRQVPDGLELYSDTSRQLSAADPLGRNLVISCGAALHHALTAAAALGWHTSTERLPEGAPSTLLARVTLRPGAPSETSEGDLRTIEQRFTDRRRFTSWPVPPETLRHLADAAAERGTHAVPLADVTRRFRAELLVAHAADRQAREPAVIDEQQRWVDHSPSDGIPSGTLPAERPSMSGRTSSRFADGIADEQGREIEGSDGLILLYGATDRPAAWLAAGEGLSALWLLATAKGLSVVPLSQVIEVDQTRHELSAQVLDGLGEPLIMVRIGWQAISRRELPRTARRPVEDVLGPR